MKKRKADYVLLWGDAEHKFIVLKDLNLGNVSVTNYVDEIIKELGQSTGENIYEYRFFYYDSEGMLSRYTWQNGVFHDFMGSWTKNLSKVIAKIKEASYDTLSPYHKERKPKYYPHNPDGDLMGKFDVLKECMICINNAGQVDKSKYYVLENWPEISYDELVVMVKSGK